jgi:elongation factor G
VFNVRSDPHVGKVCTLRVLAGRIGWPTRSSAPKSRPRREARRLFPRSARRSASRRVAKAGEIIAFTKVENVVYGESVTQVGTKPRALDADRQPEPMVAVAADAQERARRAEDRRGAAQARGRGPDLPHQHDSGRTRWSLHGMSDLHLQVMELRLKRRYGVEITTQVPKIAYRETISKKGPRATTGTRSRPADAASSGECYVASSPCPRAAA